MIFSYCFLIFAVNQILVRNMRFKFMVKVRDGESRDSEAAGNRVATAARKRMRGRREGSRLKFQWL